MKQLEAADGAATAAKAEVRLRKTVGDVIEILGLTGHSRHTVVLCWLVWFLSGWASTSLTFLLDAAGQEHGNWQRTTAYAERLTIADRSFTLFAAAVTGSSFNLVLGNASDAAGRIPVLQFCIIVQALTMIGIAFAQGKTMLIILVICTQFDGSALPAQALLAEWLPVRWRGFILVSVNAVWNIGRLSVTVLWAFLPPAQHWTAFFLVCAILPFTLAIFLVARGQRYESPRWLAVIGNMERCIETLKLAEATANADSKELPSGWDNPADMQLEGDAGEVVQVEQRTTLARFTELSEPKVLRTIAILGCCNFCISFSWSCLFYWTMEYLKVIGAHAAIVPVMLAAPLGKIMSCAILLAPYVPGECFVDRYPRTVFLKIGYFGCAICVGLLCTTTNAFALVAIMFVCMMFEGVIWEVLTLYSSEAFPTTVRSGAIGAAWLIGSTGGIVGASASGGLMDLWVYLPMVSSAILLSAGGCATFLLTQERGGSLLTDTTETPRSHNTGYGTVDAKSV